MIEDKKGKCVCPTDMSDDGAGGCIANPYGDGGTTDDAATTPPLAPNAAAAAVTSVSSSSSSDNSTDETTFVPGAVRSRFWSRL